mgnify:FL=1
MANELTGIERQLVLQYLIDGNAPITVSPALYVAKPSAQTDTTMIFPVALRAEQMHVLDQGIILLKDAPERMQKYVDTDVRVQFYFNKLGLYFITKLKRVSAGLALVMPSAIQRVTDVVAEKKHDMSAVLYYEAGKTPGGLHITCDFDEQYPLFGAQDWNDTVARYLAAKTVETSALQGTLHAPTVLYLDHERIVFGADTPSMTLGEGTEYALRLAFPLPKPLKAREVYVMCLVEQVLVSDDGKKKCALCRYTSIKEEDVRYLQEMQASSVREHADG